MAIALDSTVDGGNAASATSLSFAFNNSAGNILFVGVLGDDSSTDRITGVTYNGVAMTLIDKQRPGVLRWQYLFVLMSPPTGSHTVAISASGVCDFILAGAISYSGAQTTGQPDAEIANNSGANASTLTTSLTTITDNDWVVLFHHGFDASTAPSAGTGSTVRVVDATFGSWGFFDSNGVIHPAGSYSMTTSYGASVNAIGHILAGIIPGSGGGGGFKPYWAVQSNKPVLGTGTI